MTGAEKLARARERALPLLRELEGIRLLPYRDVAGCLTVGIGHRTSNNKAITIKQAYELADADMVAAQAAFADMADALNVNQLAALTSFVFNIGVGAFKASTMRRLLVAGKVDEAARQFGAWINVTSGGAVLPVKGLIARREAERDLFKCERNL